MKKLILASIITLGFVACKSGGDKKVQAHQDSVENAELKKVDQMRINEDSMLKEEEKRLLEKYK